jgi:hypothetical protein
LLLSVNDDHKLLDIPYIERGINLSSLRNWLPLSLRQSLKINVLFRTIFRFTQMRMKSTENSHVDSPSAHTFPYNYILHYFPTITSSAFVTIEEGCGLALMCPTKTHVLKTWSPAWYCWDVMEPLRDGPTRRF